MTSLYSNVLLKICFSLPTGVLYVQRLRQRSKSLLRRVCGWGQEDHWIVSCFKYIDISVTLWEENNVQLYLDSCNRALCMFLVCWLAWDVGLAPSSPRYTVYFFNSSRLSPKSGVGGVGVHFEGQARIVNYETDTTHTSTRQGRHDRFSSASTVWSNIPS